MLRLGLPLRCVGRALGLVRVRVKDRVRVRVRGRVRVRVGVGVGVGVRVGAARLTWASAAAESRISLPCSSSASWDCSCAAHHACSCVSRAAWCACSACTSARCAAPALASSWEWMSSWAELPGDVEEIERTASTCCWPGARAVGPGSGDCGTDRSEACCGCTSGVPLSCCAALGWSVGREGGRSVVSASTRPTETRYGVCDSGGGATPLHMPGDAAAEDIFRDWGWASRHGEFGGVDGTTNYHDAATASPHGHTLSWISGARTLGWSKLQGSRLLLGDTLAMSGTRRLLTKLTSRVVGTL